MRLRNHFTWFLMVLGSLLLVVAILGLFQVFQGYLDHYGLLPILVSGILGLVLLTTGQWMLRRINRARQLNEIQLGAFPQDYRDDEEDESG